VPGDNAALAVTRATVGDEAVALIAGRDGVRDQIAKTLGHSTRAYYQRCAHRSSLSVGLHAPRDSELAWIRRMVERQLRIGR